MASTNNSEPPEERPIRWMADNYSEILLLGTGSQSSVILTRNRRTKALAAIKRAPNRISQVSKMTQREARFLQTLRMKSIVRLEDFYKTPTDWILILEACDWDLHHYIDGYRDGPNLLPQLFVWRAFSRIADALAFCHHQGVVHHDVKPANIFLKWEGRDPKTRYPDLVLADFGAATWQGEDSNNEDGAPGHTPTYHPPDSSRGPSMDVWALGCVIHEMALRRPVVKPVPDEVKADPLRKELWYKDPNNKRIGRGIDQLYSPELELFMYACLRFKVSNRIDAKTLSREVRAEWRKKTTLLPFEPLARWCQQTVEEKTISALQERDRAARAARPRMGTPESAGKDISETTLVESHPQLYQPVSADTSDETTAIWNRPVEAKD